MKCCSILPPYLQSGWKFSTTGRIRPPEPGTGGVEVQYGSVNDLLLPLHLQAQEGGWGLSPACQIEMALKIYKCTCQLSVLFGSFSLRDACKLMPEKGMCQPHHLHWRQKGTEHHAAALPPSPPLCPSVFVASSSLTVLWSSAPICAGDKTEATSWQEHAYMPSTSLVWKVKVQEEMKKSKEQNG